MLATLGAVIFALMALEAHRAAANEAAQRARGGVEPPGDVYPWMRVAYPAAFLAMLVEGAVRGGASPSLAAAGGGLLVASKALKWWAVAALGQAWTFRVIVVPGAPLTTTGPYCVLRHPNYVAVVGELVSVALMTGARVTGPLALVGFGLLIVWRIRVEERALRAPSTGRITTS